MEDGMLSREDVMSTEEKYNKKEVYQLVRCDYCGRLILKGYEERVEIMGNAEWPYLSYDAYLCPKCYEKAIMVDFYMCD
ncbi:MAG: hypothetical protein WC476_00895 [Phycisphaerae bacterium]